MQKQKPFWFFSFLIFFFPFATSASIPLVYWDFANSSTQANPVGSIFDNLTQKITTVGINTPTVSISSGFVTANGWNSSATEKYWFIPFITNGYENLSLSLKMGGSSTGPRDFALEYQVGDDENWHSVPNGTITLTAISTTTNPTITDLPLPAALNNQENVSLRLLLTSNNSILPSASNPTGVIQTSGPNRLDNIRITGTAITDATDEDPLNILCTGNKEDVTVTELLPAPTTSNNEYVELFNAGAACVNLTGWRIEDAGRHSFILPPNTLIEGGQYLSFIRNFYLNNSTEETIILFDDDNEERSRINYEKALFDFSYSFNGSDFVFSSFQTPGAANIFDEITEEDPAETSNGSIIINELLPNPLGDEVAGEYIELYNPSNEEVSLKNWVLRDTSKTRVMFTSEALEPFGYLFLPRTAFKFSLNNTGNETVSLLRPDGSLASSVSYTSTKENFSYSFTGKDWKFTDKLTPGAENKFSKEPKIVITGSKKGFVDTPVMFGAKWKKSAKGKTTYLWNFGDGHTSRLATPKHTFTKTGKYSVSVTLKNASKEVSKTFTIKITDYPKLPVVITRLSPNPKGKDTGTEWLEIQNLGDKEVNLKNWKLATGSDQENLGNHNFLTDVILAPGSIQKITKTHNTFSLHNTANIVELRYPSGNAASTTAYQEESIAEDAVCFNINGICDFKDAPQKEDEIERLVEKTLPTTQEKPTDSGENTITETYTPPEKTVLKNKILEDTNTLFNIYLQEFWP